MSHTHKITTRLQLDNGPTLSGQATLTGGKSISISEPIAAEAVDVEFPVAIDVSQLKSIYIIADVGLSVEFIGPAGSPITVEPTRPYHWNANSGVPLPFDADITSITVDNGESVDGTVQIEILVDPTI